jgi:hypothetical protein
MHHRRRLKVREAFTHGVAWWLLSAAYVMLLAAPGATLPADRLGIRVFQTPPLGASTRFGQTFTMTADGLHAIEIFPLPVSGPVSGSVRFELHELDRGYREVKLVRMGEARAIDVVRSSSYRFEFAPIADSNDRAYRFDILGSEAEGVAFWATKGGRYGRGTMHVNGRERWADLGFRVYAPNPSVFSRLLMLRDTNPVRAYLAFASGVGIWLLLGFVLRTVRAILIPAT